MMNLEKLFEMQKEFDESVVKKKGLENEYLFTKKKLALRTELGELANELPSVFKFWSNKKDNREKALVEYVDGFHFVLSLTLEGAGEFIDNIIHEVELTDIYNSFVVISEFEHVYKAVQFVTPGDEYYYFTNLITRYIHLGITIGFTWDEIEQAYMEKNKINHVRQETGY